MAKAIKTKTETRVQRAVDRSANQLNKPYELEKKIDELVELVQNTLVDSKAKLQFLSAFGVGSEHGEYFTCHKCGRVLSSKDFYISTEFGCESGIAPICKDCAASLARPIIDGYPSEPTKESVCKALDFLRKPFIEKVWDSSVSEAANMDSGRVLWDAWSAYARLIQMKNYYGLNYSNSDFYTGGLTSLEDSANTTRDQEIIDSFEKNKSDTLRLLGYLPFEQEKTVDQPFLYAQLIGFLDSSEEGNDDMMRTSSIISIVRSFLQLNQIDDMIAKLSQDVKNLEVNVPKLKALQQMKANISSMITKLAQESCISLKNTKNAKKGENTWTGKLKKIKELNLREGEVNGFDLNTCKGMMQVMEMSDASIMKQLHLDESEWSDMVAEQRAMIRDLQNKLDFYTEAARIILRENIDLRDTLNEHNLLNESCLVDIEDLYSPLISNYSKFLEEESLTEEVEEVIEEDDFESPDLVVEEGEADE